MNITNTYLKTVNALCFFVPSCLRGSKFRGAGFFLWMLFVAFSLTSCEKDDQPVVLPPPGDMQVMSASMGVNYDNQVYVDLETGNQKSVPYRSYDLAFEASPQGWRVYLNTGKFMFVANTGSTDMTAADSTGKVWKTETEHLYNDSTAFGSWTNGSGQSLNEVYVIDRGRTEHFGAARWRKMQLLEVTPTHYRFRFSFYNNTQLTEFTIPKNNAYSLIYFSFDNNGQVADVAPPKNQWDVVFTKYTYTYYTEPVNSPYRYYLVTGALLNRWAGCENEIVKKDSTPNFRPFEELTSMHIGEFDLTPLAGKIGFSWKEYDFNLGYIIYPDRYYLLRDPSQFVYKIRFIDFYDNQGNKGTAKFEYQRM
jgi:hypothetical protein